MYDALVIGGGQAGLAAGYYLKRIGEDDLVISWETRNEILKRLAGNAKYIQIGEYTIMLNAIKEMAPYWKPNNIPPRPKPVRAEKLLGNGAYSVTENDDDGKEWDKHFG